MRVYGRDIFLKLETPAEQFSSIVLHGPFCLCCEPLQDAATGYLRHGPEALGGLTQMVLTIIVRMSGPWTAPDEYERIE